jgi:NhaP-type Na+/H+ or K+/H+ antiporter
MRTPGPQFTAVYGRRWRLFLLWYVEICAAGAAVWALTGDARPRTLLVAFAYFLLCGAALALPAHVLRHLLTTAGVPPAYRRLALQLLLAFAAAATAATLSTAQGWAAIVFILLVGDTLWALELELRVEAAEDARGA